MDCGRKLEYPEKTHTCKLHIERHLRSDQGSNPGPSCCEVTLLTRPCHPYCPLQLFNSIRIRNSTQSDELFLFKKRKKVFWVTFWVKLLPRFLLLELHFKKVSPTTDVFKVSKCLHKNTIRLNFFPNKINKTDDWLKPELYSNKSAVTTFRPHV